MKPTPEQGCATCRHAIYSGNYDWRELPRSMKRHAYLYRCGVCGSNWETGERAAFEITPEEAAAILKDDEPLSTLRSRLAAEGFRSDVYDLGNAEHPSETYVLRARDGAWVTFYAERGHENDLEEHTTFADAESDLLGRLRAGLATRQEA